VPTVALIPYAVRKQHFLAPAYIDYENGTLADADQEFQVLVEPDEPESFWETAGDGYSPIARVLVGGPFQTWIAPLIPVNARIAWLGGEFDAWWGVQGPSTDPGPVSYRMRIGVEYYDTEGGARRTKSLPITLVPAVRDQWTRYRLTPYVPPYPPHPAAHWESIESWQDVWVDIGTEYTPLPVNADGEAAAGPWVRFGYLRCELMWVGPPAAEIVEPDTTIDTGRPEVSWTYTPGEDGGPQVAYRVAAGPSSTYSGGWTSGPEMDTGIVYSSDTETVLPGQMVNGVEYHIDVDVAQMVNGVLHWAGATSVETTATFSPPDDPIVTPVINNDDGYIALNIDLGGDRHADQIMIERSANGIDGWVPLVTDTEAIQALVPEAGVLGFRDFETLGNGVASYYRVKTLLIVGANHAASEWVEVGPIEWSSASVFLKAPGRPWLNDGFMLMAGSLRELQTGQDRGVFDVLGRRFPVVVNGGRKGQTGTLFVGIVDADPDPITTRARLGALLEEDPLIVQAPDEFGGWSNRTVSVGEVTERSPIPKIDQPQRIFELPVTELDPVGRTAIIEEGPYLDWLAYWIIS
jgi:hypothetical protein